MRIHRIGHSNRPLNAFVKLLQAHRIEVLADVRRFPGSRKHPQYNGDALAVSLAEDGIEYVFLGESLGGRRPRSVPASESPNGGLQNGSFRNFADYMMTPEFREGVDRLRSLAAGRAVCVMCSEGWWARCHRRLIADYLVADGTEVRHISSRIRAEPHQLDPIAVGSPGRVLYPPHEVKNSG
jgi:uncharacterized protein (DUF488 family)